MDTRTARTPTGRTSRGFYDSEPGLSTVKVPSDPAQVIVNHASFRVEFNGPPPGGGGVAAGSDTAMPAPQQREPLGHGGRGASREPLPGEVTARWLSPAAARRAKEGDGTSTQVLPRISADTDLRPPSSDDDPTLTTPLTAPRTVQRQRLRVVVRPRRAELATPAPAPSRPRSDELDDTRPDGIERPDTASTTTLQLGMDGQQGHPPEERPTRRGPDTIRHSYYPGRRMNLGVVLLPLRVFLGFFSIYAGMGKLTNPVFFDGGERGSMVSWLRSLEPWSVATPLHELAVSHPVGAGLTVAFLHIIVGVLTIFGLWQRLVAAIGMLLSMALIVTVSWRATPVYDAPDIIYLAAWSPLVIAGAPVYSLDGRLASEAWRRLGPRSALWELRRRVLRRGTTIATVLVGLALLIGSLLGGAVRSTQVTTVRTPEHPPTNHRLGSPLPQAPGTAASRASQRPWPSVPAPGRTAGNASPSASRDEAADRPSPRPRPTPGRERQVPAPPVPRPSSAPRLPEAPPASDSADSGGSGDSGGSSGRGKEKDRSDEDKDDERGALGGLLG